MALVITRRPGESALIGRQIRLTVLEIEDRRVTVEVARTDGSASVERAFTGTNSELKIGPVTVTARRMSPGFARVSIDCPRHIQITRSELVDAAPEAAAA
jgi:sRNA-binding carbon storage regulator CsrA